MTENHDEHTIRDRVRTRYSQIVKLNTSCCGGGNGPQSGSGACCCAPDTLGQPEVSTQLGYSAEDLSAVPEGANMGLGCGNPQAIAQLRPGETVLDLGSGGGFDCFLASRQVGPTGKVIGVDMTSDMIAAARANAVKGSYHNVEFRLGEIEHLPLADYTVDVIISNCVINLSPAKEQVFSEAYRVLRAKGRLAISDVVAIAPLPDQVKRSLDAHCGCVAGAALVSDLEQMLTNAGFSSVSVQVKEDSDEFIKDWFPGSGVEKYVRSAVITAVK